MSAPINQRTKNVRCVTATYLGITVIIFHPPSASTAIRTSESHTIFYLVYGNLFLSILPNSVLFFIRRLPKRLYKDYKLSNRTSCVAPLYFVTDY